MSSEAQRLYNDRNHVLEVYAVDRYRYNLCFVVEARQF